MNEKLIIFTLNTLGLNSQLAMRKETLAIISAHSLAGKVTIEQSFS